MVEPSSNAELSFGEFSETLETCVGLTQALFTLAEVSPHLMLEYVNELESCLHRIGVLRTVNKRHASSCHVEAINELLLHRATDAVRVTSNSQLFESWHEAAIHIVVGYHTAVFHCVKGMDRYQRAPTDDFSAVCEWLRIQEPVDWEKVVFGLKKERRLIGSSDPGHNGERTAAQPPVDIVCTPLVTSQADGEKKAAIEPAAESKCVIPATGVAVDTPETPTVEAKQNQQTPPYLGLVFNFDSTVNRIGKDYAHLQPIHLSEQPLRLLKFIHEAGERGRTVNELVPGIVANKRILTTEKSRLDLSEIDIDLGGTGEYVVRCTKKVPL